MYKLITQECVQNHQINNTVKASANVPRSQVVKDFLGMVMPVPQVYGQNSRQRDTSRFFIVTAAVDYMLNLVRFVLFSILHLIFMVIEKAFRFNFAVCEDVVQQASTPRLSSGSFPGQSRLPAAARKMSAVPICLTLTTPLHLSTSSVVTSLIDRTAPFKELVGTIVGICFHDGIVANISPASVGGDDREGAGILISVH